MPLQHEEFPSSHSIPEPRRTVGRTRGDPPAIGADHEPSERAAMAGQHGDLAGRGHVPDPGRAVGRCRDETTTIGCEPDRNEFICMPRECVEFATPDHVPEPGRAIEGAPGSSGNAFSIGTEYDGRHTVGMTIQHCVWCSRGGIPQPRRPIHRSGCQERAIRTECHGTNVVGMSTGLDDITGERIPEQESALLADHRHAAGIAIHGEPSDSQ